MKILIYSGTHWDREWYSSFQGFRARLVSMMDNLIETMEKNPEAGVFHLDGQTIVLEDYLQIQPQMRDRLTKLIQSGKVIIGPWYDMPDEFLISGESMIKNIRLGTSICREQYGVEPPKNGYICDIFGHNSQTPQVMKSLGLYHTILGRGTNRRENEKFFRWQAPDGSELLAFRLDDIYGYDDFGWIAGQAPSDQPARIDEVMAPWVKALQEEVNIPLVVIMDAGDHHFIRPDTVRYLESFRRLAPDAEVVHATVDRIGEEMAKYAGQMPVVRGELTRPGSDPGGYVHVITNTLSSRYPLKKYNDKNQTLLEKWIQPLYGLHRTGMSYGFVREANRYLLKNHPHDSICGCSIDQVHRDMLCRFDQTRLICGEILNPFVASLGGDCGEILTAREEVNEGVILRIYNPLPYEVSHNVTADVNFGGLAVYREPFGYEDIPAVYLFDNAGNKIPFGFTDLKDGGNATVSFDAKLDAMTVTEFFFRPSDMPTRQSTKMEQTATSVCGDCARLEINANGTVNLTDLATGEVYSNLLTLVDNGEIGDGWFHCDPAIDRTVSGTSCTVEKLENSPDRIVFRIRVGLELPEEIVWKNGIHRSEATVSVPVVHTVTFSRHAKGIEVQTVIDNCAKDHRIRLLLPAVAGGDTYEAAQMFDYVTRTCGCDPNTEEWKEFGGIERNFANLVAKRNGKRGLAFVSAYGLHECGVEKNGDMYVTLARCYRKTVGTAGEPDGQLQGRLEYRYEILPFTAGDSFASLQREQDILAAGIVTNAVRGKTIHTYRPQAFLGNPAWVYSTCDLLPDGTTEFRFFNDSPETTEGEVILPSFVTAVRRIELDGRVLETPLPKNGKVFLTVSPFKIVTLQLS